MGIVGRRGGDDAFVPVGAVLVRRSSMPSSWPASSAQYRTYLAATYHTSAGSRKTAARRRKLRTGTARHWPSSPISVTGTAWP